MWVVADIDTYHGAEYNTKQLWQNEKRLESVAPLAK